jgi:hypothetical protein
MTIAARKRTRQSSPVPRLKHIRRNVSVAPPRDCDASVILKQVAHDKRHRYFACMLMVGRYDRDALKVPYEFTGETTVRCDLPTGSVISAAVLQPHLVKFLKAEGNLPDPPPIIIGKGPQAQ